MKIKLKIKRSNLLHYCRIVKYYYDQVRMINNMEIKDYCDYFNLKFLLMILLNRIHETIDKKRTQSISITIDINSIETLIRLSNKITAPFDSSYENILLNLIEDATKKINEQHWHEQYQQLGKNQFFNAARADK